MSPAVAMLSDARRLCASSTDAITRDYWHDQCRQIADFLIQRWA